MSDAPSTSPKKKERHLLATVMTIAVMAVLAVFVWRVVHYMRLIQSGGIVDLEESYAQEMSISRLAAAAASANNNVEVDSVDDPSLGSENAALTIVEFADFGCPYSRQVSFLMRSLVYEYGDQIRYVYRDFPLVDLHPDAARAAEAGECADDQGKFWELHDKMYQNQSDLSEEAVVQYARELDLDMGRFLSCLSSHAYAAEIQEDYEAGLAAGVVGTPTFFFNGIKVEGAIPADVLRALIDRLVADES